MTAPAVPATPTNMISNGTFDNGDDWTLTNGITITGGYLNCALVWQANVTQPAANMVQAMVPSTDYTISFDVSNSTGGGPRFLVLTEASWTTLVAEASYSDGSYSINFTTPGTIEASAGLRLAFYNDDETGLLDNISLILR